jgi:hypothetical protein
MDNRGLYVIYLLHSGLLNAIISRNGRTIMDRLLIENMVSHRLWKYLFYVGLTTRFRELKATG